MPEYPDVVLYVERLAAYTVGRPIQGIRLGSPFVVRTAVPPIAEADGKTVRGIRRIGKRLVLELIPESSASRPADPGDPAAEPLFLVIHLMIAGRLRWKTRGSSHRAKDVLAVFDFPDGSLVFTEASMKKRASIHLVRGEPALAQFDRGGLEVFGTELAAFVERMQSERHTVKRSLTDPTLFSGIGNAYSDEILFRARMSPVKLSTSLTDDELSTLLDATREVLTEWADRFRTEIGEGFPDKVTAFRPEMAVHGKFRQPCPRCGHPIQRIVQGENECNYCAHCQTGGRLLADRALSQLLKSDWPKTLEELEERRQPR